MQVSRKRARLDPGGHRAFVFVVPFFYVASHSLMLLLLLMAAMASAMASALPVLVPSAGGQSPSPFAGRSNVECLQALVDRIVSTSLPESSLALIDLRTLILERGLEVQGLVCSGPCLGEVMKRVFHRPTSRDDLDGLKVVESACRVLCTM
jgi:hypothetical protein